MLPDVAVVDGPLYKARDFDCIGTQIQQWGLDTYFRGWANVKGTVWYSDPCDTMQGALQLAEQIYAQHA
jgi:hypothetical protein